MLPPADRATTAVDKSATTSTKPTELTLQSFYDWTDNCRARRIQKEFAKIVQDAQSKGITPDAELKNLGFRDHNDWQKSCKKFSIFCRPSDLAELGSGFVLYFHLLRFMAGVLIVLGLFQIPMLVWYGKDRNGDLWSVQNINWMVHYDSNGDQKCACLGSNNGEFGPFNKSDYGTSCKAWDKDLCSGGPPGTKPGKWCCRSWCFSGRECPLKPDKTSPSLSNQPYANLVRAVQPCINQQNDALMASVCAGLPDDPFPVVKPPPGKGIISWTWLTPGNCGPDMCDRTPIVNLYLVCVVLMCIAIVGMFQHQRMMDSWVDAATIMPRDYAILVKNLPETATEEQTIIDFFSENAVPEQKTEIVKVIIGWSAAEFNDKMKHIKARQKELGRLMTAGAPPEHVANLKTEIRGLKKELAQPKTGSLKSTGSAVVVFRKQEDLHKCLRKWTGFWARVLYRQPLDCCSCSRVLFGRMLPGAQLPYFRLGDFAWTKPLRIKQAPNPGDIQWEELCDVGTWKSFRKKVKTNLFMVILLAVCFVITWLLIRLKTDHIQKEMERIQKEGGSDELKYGVKGISFLPAIVISVINVLLGMAARKWGAEEYHETFTSEEFSQAYKMSLAMFFNTSGILFWTNAQPQLWYINGGLVDQIFYMFIMDATISRLLLFLDITYMTNICKRRRLTQEKVDQWNETIKKNYPPKSEDQAEALEELQQEVESWKAVFEPEELDNPYRYAMALSTFLCAVLYAPLLPFGVYLAAFGLIMQYWVDKILLLRWNKRPTRPQNREQALWSVRGLRFIGPVGLSAGTVVFLFPSWALKDVVFSRFVVAIIISVIVLVLPMRFWTTILGCRCLMRRMDWTNVVRHQEDYYQAQHMWPKDLKYHKSHFLYKCLPKADNPEILVEGVSAVTTSDVLQAHYGAALHQVVYLSGAAAPGAASGPVTGFRPTAVGGSLPVGPRPVADVAGSVPPTVYGVSGAVAGASATIPVHAPVTVTASTAGAKRGYWEFETKSGYSAFTTDAQDALERAYRDYKDGRGSSTVQVQSGSAKVSVDLHRMEQHLVGAERGRTRQVRRRDSE